MFFTGLGPGAVPAARGFGRRWRGCNCTSLLLSPRSLAGFGGSAGVADSCSGVSEVQCIGNLRTHGCRFLVLDEVDELLAFNFREDMHRIVEHVGRRGLDIPKCDLGREGSVDLRTGFITRIGRNVLDVSEGRMQKQLRVVTKPCQFVEGNLIVDDEILLTTTASAPSPASSSTSPTPSERPTAGFTTGELAVFKPGLGVEVPRDERYRAGLGDLVHALMSALVFLAIALSDHRVTGCVVPGGHGKEMDEAMQSFPLMVGIVCSGLFLVFPTTRYGIGCVSP
ncbi:DEAD-box ATP-dependent RNA helicase 47B [Striga asiatica]|uniref:DEAD-box ATP-dependent RNA helicase 47B n=1 Tax=Striga asiatica TaxID=4170 RepID=A0A5A7QVU9_STRAF|nr:DEAD-box ATP-dependent RNA helicase 47B [Striga asiatica]